MFEQRALVKVGCPAVITVTIRHLVCAAMLVAVAGVAAEAQTLPINVYSQRDARWSGDKMGTSGLTVGNYGCMMTSLAAAYRVTPGTLNAYLSKKGGYTSDGLLNHSVAANYDGSGGMQYVGPGTLPNDASSVGRGIGRGAVYITQSSRFGAGKHWVLVYNAIPGGQSYYLDPSDGTTRRVGDGWVSYGASARIYSIK